MIDTDDQNSKICVHSGFAGCLLHFRGFTVAFQARFIFGLQYILKQRWQRTDKHTAVFLLQTVFTEGIYNNDNKKQCKYVRLLPTSPYQELSPSTSSTSLSGLDKREKKGEKCGVWSALLDFCPAQPKHHPFLCEGENNFQGSAKPQLILNLPQINPGQQLTKPHDSPPTFQGQHELHVFFTSEKQHPWQATKSIYATQAQHREVLNTEPKLSPLYSPHLTP